MSSDPTRSLPPDPHAKPDETGAYVPQPNHDRVTDGLLQPPETATVTGCSPSPEETSPTSPPTTDHEIHIPGYEIEGELGRGGMGVVYKARHLRLNRSVALKMVLGSGATDSRAVIRFLAEAEAVAAVKHPHVVHIHDFGEANGHPFMALEYLSGGCLTDVLASGKREPMVLAELVGKIARGVAAAHELGIVHRDLKPANILFDAAGEPKVTDFGLAKRNNGSDLTATQAVMGTPAYMSPEQAKGDTKFVGPQGDVWALGVILYECLTGIRPFHANDVRALLLQLLTTDPVPVRTHDRTIPRDLELICLKCLSREPHERYPTAKELADDLDRFGRGEPISVRAAGPVERGYKWVKRNKAVSGALAAVTMALVIGSVVSLAFALEARNQAKLADDATEREKVETRKAEKAASDATRKGNELAKVNITLEQSVDDLNNALASAFLAPIREDRRDGTLTPYEVEAFWALTSHRGSPVCSRFLEGATLSPLASEQLASRAEYALHAAIGLDQDAWEKANRLLIERLNTPDYPGDQRRGLLMACSRMQGLPPALAARAAIVLVDTMTKTTDPLVLGELAKGLAAVAGRTPPDVVASTCSAAAMILADAMTRNFDPLTLWQLSAGLAAVVGRMPLDAAAKIITDAMAKAMDRNMSMHPNSLAELAKILAAVAGRMPPDSAASTCSAAVVILTDVMIKTSVAESLQGLPTGLAVVAGQMPPERAALLVKILTDAMAKTTKPVALAEFAKVLAAVAGHLPPDAAVSTYSAAAIILTDAMAKPVQPYALAELAKALAAVAGPIPPKAVADLLMERMTKATSSHSQGGLAVALAAVAGRMTPEDAARTCSAVAMILTEAMTRTTDAYVLGELAKGLVAVAVRMTPEEAAKTLTDRMTKTTNPHSLGELAKGLVAVAGRMPPDSAANTCSAAAEILTNAMAKPVIASSLAELAVALAAVAERMPPDEAANTCSAAAEILTNAMTKGTHPADALRQLALGLAAVAGRMRPEDAAKVLTQSMTRTAVPLAQVEFAAILTAIAQRMPPDRAANTCSAAAKILSDAMTEHMPPGSLRELAVGLAAVSGGMPADEAARACSVAAKSLTDAMANKMYPQNRRPLEVALAVIAGRMPPDAAAKILTDAISRTRDPLALRELALILAAIGGRMPPDVATSTYSAAAKILTDAMAKDMPPNSLRELAVALAAVAGGMPPDRAARTLTDVMGTGWMARQMLAMRLRNVACGFPLLHRERASVFAVGGFATPSNLLPGLPLLHPQFQPQPRPLPPQHLVELLKHPFCVGEARRAVLDALEFTYNRPFADQWEFVQYVKDNRLPLDLLTPPKRLQRER